MALFEFKISPSEPEKKPARRKKKLKTMDVALVVLLLVMLTFTSVMIWIFLKVGSVPDSLVTAVFAVCGGECGVMGWIKTTKDKINEKKEKKENDE